ncbi:MAG: NAD(P)-dependent oxidoreductase [Agathobacter sp.]|nr:NAD(P)-dependent oxidoreductase [Agathobacter sp.]
MERIVVTGPTGAIGLALLEKCIKEKVFVYAVCRPDSKRICHIPKSKYITIIECGLDDLKKLPSLIEERVDVFYHFGWKSTFGASRNDMTSQWENIGYALEAVEVAAQMGCHTFIGAGSQAEYGRVEGKLSEHTAVNPENGYGMAKLCAGQMTRIRCEQLGIKHIWTRILSVYGPGDGMQTMIMSTLEKLIKKERPALTLGEQRWDYLYSEDCANALYLLGERGKSGKVYCIGSGNARPLKEYINEMKEIVWPDGILGFGDIPYGENQVMNLCADIEQLQRDTGFCPVYRFEDGIRETVEWLKGEEDLWNKIQ